MCKIDAWRYAESSMLCFCGRSSVCVMALKVSKYLSVAHNLSWRERDERGLEADLSAGYLPYRLLSG